MAAWGLQNDDFPGSALGALWLGSYGTAYTVTGNKVSFPIGADYSGISSYGFDLTSSQVLIKADPTAGGFAGMRLARFSDALAIAEIEYDPVSDQYSGVIRNTNWGGGADASGSTAGPATGPVWFRARHASTTLYLEFSTDAASWTTLISATPTAGMATALTTATVELYTGPTLTGPCTFSKLNLAAVNATATPARVAGVTTMPASTGTGTATVAPSLVASVATIPAPQPRASTSPTPGRVNAVAALPAPTVTHSGSLIPGRVSATSDVQLPTVYTTVTVAPGVLSAFTVVRAPTLQATAVGEQPVRLAATTGIPLPTLSGTSHVIPTRTNGVVAVYDPTMSISAATPARLNAVAAVFLPDVTASSSGITPNRFDTVVTVWVPTLVPWYLHGPDAKVVAVLPPAQAALRGQFRVLEAAGQPDLTFVCARLADGTFDWDQISA